MDYDNIGRSDYTFTKQEHFSKILRMHINITKAVLNKHKNECWCKDIYNYFDLNAGAGIYNIQGKQVKGSPIIFAETAAGIDLKCNAVFVERDEESYRDLFYNSRNYKFAKVVKCDNNNIIDYQLFNCGKYSYGLIYSDPNNHEIPFDTLTKFCLNYPRMEILIHVSATCFKRVAQHGYSGLFDQLSGLNKKYWFVREPANTWQWTFLFGTNWNSFKDYHDVGLYNANSEKGQTIIERLSKTKSEIKEYYQPSFFLSDEKPYNSYSEYLKHPEFLKIRAKVMERSAGNCEKCSNKATEVHHLKYPPWGTFDVPENMIAICHKCHCLIHRKEN